MNVREEDRQKSTCTGRGLGLAAAAIGVGVGAAMYYFFSKRPENPHNEGSTSDWNCERPESFPLMDSEDEYMTVSEHDTTDTSINQTILSDNVTASEESEPYSDTSDSEDEESLGSNESTDDSDPSLNENNYNSPSANSNMSLGEMTFDDSSPETHMGDVTFDDSGDVNEHILGDMTFDEDSSNNNILGTVNGSQGSDSDSSLVEVTYEQYIDDYDIMIPVRQALDDLKRLFDIRSGKTQDEQAQLVNLRQQAFRERTWTLEECSICFDVMLRNQELMALPCTHNFHTGCILPWLQEKQTCPVCRKTVE